MVRNDLYKAACRGARFIRGFLDSSCLVSTDVRDSLFVGSDWSETALGFTDLRGAALVSLRNLERVQIMELPAHAQQETGRTHADNSVDLEMIQRSADLQRVLTRNGVTSSSPPELFAQFVRTLGVNQAFVDAYYSILQLPDTNLQSVFICYSSHDQAFADRLFDALKQRGVRAWYAPKNMKGGQQIHEQIHAAIHSHDRVLLVLSATSMKSSWVSTEIGKAYAREISNRARVLFPITLLPFESLKSWELFDADHGNDLARYIRRFFIPDFSDWRSTHLFEEQTSRLVADLRLDETRA
jgi:hypothetical protein